MLSSWSPWRRRRRQVPVRCPRYRPQLEVLEDRLLLSHSPLGPEFPVSATPVAAQFAPPSTAVASDACGDFVVAWTASDSASQGNFDIFAQRFNAAGVAQGGPINVSGGPIPLSSFTDNVTVDVAMDGVGDFVVVYDANLGQSGSAVIAHRYAANGNDLGSQQVSAPNMAAFQPSVAAGCDGNFVVAYAVLQGDSFFEDVFAQQFDANGNAQGGPIQVDTANTPLLTGPSVSSDDAGNFVVTWNALAGESPEIVARRFSAAGAPLDAQPFVVSTNASTDSIPDVAVAGDTGAFVVTWNIDAFSASLQTLTILAQRFDASGQPAGSTFTVNTAPLDGPAVPHVAADGIGSFAIGWSTGQGLLSVDVRFFAADGTPEGAQVKANTTSQDLGPSDVASDGSGDVVMVWSGMPQGQQGDNILARIFTSSIRDPDDCRCGASMTPPVPTTPTQPVSPVVPAPLPAVVTIDQSQAELISLVRGVAHPPATLDPFVLLTLATPKPPPEVFPQLPSLIGGELPDTRLSGDGRTDMVGEISGVVFQDLNGNGIQDEGERGLAGQLVFLDLNDNGVFDPSEPFMITDARGHYLFGGLALTRYSVRQDLRQVRLRQTMPAHNAAHIVNLSPAVNSVAGKDFGTLLSPVAGISSQESPQEEPPAPEE